MQHASGDLPFELHLIGSCVRELDMAVLLFALYTQN